MTTIQTVATPLSAEANGDTRAVLLNHVSWGAIFAGAVTALVTQVIVNLVGVGVGLASVGTNAADNPSASTVSMVAVMWIVGSRIVAELACAQDPVRLSVTQLSRAALPQEPEVLENPGTLVLFGTQHTVECRG
ncbi:hypothetical protein MKK88_28675, partial [Methylobacterium sp. E-005]|nr:hypothetical protein [Methylobacterium sp. E-005]